MGKGGRKLSDNNCIEAFCYIHLDLYTWRSSYYIWNTAAYDDPDT